jgi:hypothetical protein
MNAIKIGCDLRPRFGRARDQGKRETCLAFAVSDAHSAVRGDPWAPLSCEYLFYHSKQRDKGLAHQGTTISAIRTAMQLDGQPVEKGWPYLKQLPKDLANWKPPTSVGTPYRRGSDNTGSAFNEVWAAVEAGTPTVMAMTISKAFFLPDADCVVDSAEAADPSLRHAVLGVATGARASQKLILVRNSWGESWGCSGYAWLSERYAGTRIFSTITIK